MRLGFRQGVTLDGLLAGDHQVRDGAGGRVAVLEVVGDRLGVLAGAVAEQLLHRLRNAAVQLLPLAAQQSRVGDLLRQGVLEQVLRGRHRRRACGSGPPTRAPRDRLRASRRRRVTWLRIVKRNSRPMTDASCRMARRSGVEPVDARGDDAADRRRHGGRVELAGQRPALAVVRASTWFSSRPLTISSTKNGLPLVRSSRNVTSSSGTSRDRAATRRDRACRDRRALQPDLADAAFMKRELRAVVEKRHHRREDSRRELPQQIDGRGVGPVEILQAEDQGPALGERLHEHAHRSSSRLGRPRGRSRSPASLRCRRAGAAAAGPRTCSDEGADALFELLPHGLGRVGLVDAEAVADEIGDRVVGDVLRERVGAALEPGGVGGDARAELFDEARLAGAGLGRDRDERAVAFARAIELVA